MMLSLFGAIQLRLFELRSSLKNFLSAQYSPYFSPFFMGDEAKGYERELTKEELAELRRNQGQYEPKLPEVAKDLVDGHLPICGYFLAVYLIAVSYIYFVPWGEVRRSLWDIYGGSFQHPVLAMIIGYRIAHNALLAVLYLLEVTHKRWHLLWAIPLGVLRSVPFALFPTTVIYFVWYANTTFSGVKNNLFDAYFSARALANLIKLAAISPGRFSKNLLKASVVVKARPFTAFSAVTSPYALFVGSVSVFFLLAIAHQMIVLFAGGVFDYFEWYLPYREFNFFGYGVAFTVMMHGVADYNATIRLHQVLLEYDVIHQAREKGACIQDKLEIKALSRLNYSEDDVTSLSELPTILAPRLGLEDPYCFVGPHLPVDPRERADFYWQDLYEHRLDDPNRLLPEREALAGKRTA